MSNSTSVQALWLELRQHLKQRYQALFDEVRHYPTPIAHCDDQLPKLIEQRSHALWQLQRMGDEPVPTGDGMRAFLATTPCTDDDTEANILAQLRIALDVPPPARIPRIRVAQMYTDTRD